ncbi:MAG: alpha/beta hydrolase [Pseudomonadota bacterium]
MRADYRAASAQAGVPDPVARVEDLAISASHPTRTIAVRLYAPASSAPLPVLVFAHGGGFASGDLETHDVLARTIARRAQANVLVVDYRLAPEAPFPAGLHDVYAVLQWAAENAAQIGGDPARIAVGGDSAGGNLAAAAALMARDQHGPRIVAQWLMYPMLGVTQDTPSWREHGATRFPTRDVIEQVLAAYAPDPVLREEPLVAPVLAQLAGLPPALVQVGDLDPLLDEGRDYARRLVQAGVRAEAVVYPGQGHGFMQLYQDGQQHALGEAAVDDGVAFLGTVFGR